MEIGSSRYREVSRSREFYFQVCLWGLNYERWYGFTRTKEIKLLYFFHSKNTRATVYLFIKIKKYYFPDFLGIDTFEAPFLEVAFAADFVGAAFF